MPIKSGIPTSSAGDATTTTAAPKTQSLLMTSPTTSSRYGSGTPESGGKFEVTQEYIQQTIQNALKKDNLSPGMFLCI